MVNRVDITPAAADMVRRLQADNGRVMFHQSGGCCDGSSPMCFPHGEFITGDADVHLADLDVQSDEPGAPTTEPVEVWMSREQFAYWSHTHLTIDLVPGRGAGFSLEGPTGFRFLIRSRVFTDAEAAQLAPV
ncbi:MAG: DUF779 domain-containing protein [Nocardioides sp.]